MLWFKGWFALEYALPVAFGIALTTFASASRPVEIDSERRVYGVLQLITLISAVIGGKIGALVGDYGWPFQAAPPAIEILASGRSLAGALLFGYIGSEMAKPLFNYRSRPNDRFALALVFSIAIGRLGCWLAGCCRGVPYDGFLGVRYPDETFARFPAPLFELGFHVLLGSFLLVMSRSGRLAGRVFASYMITYGAYRFFSEFLRATPKLLGPLSVYQVLALLLVAAGAFSFVRNGARAALPRPT